MASIRPWSTADFVWTGDVISRDSSSRVVHAIERATGEEFAVKVRTFSPLPAPQHCESALSCLVLPAYVVMIAWRLL